MRCRRKVRGVCLLLALLVVLAGCGSPEDDQQVYFAPASGTKYHRTQDCRGLSNAKSTSITTPETGQRKGLSPCKICRP
jgi:uncharacterized lipoprotein YmbA